MLRCGHLPWNLRTEQVEILTSIDQYEKKHIISHYRFSIVVICVNWSKCDLWVCLTKQSKDGTRTKSSKTESIPRVWQINGMIQGVVALLMLLLFQHWPSLSSARGILVGWEANVNHVISDNSVPLWPHQALGYHWAVRFKLCFGRCGGLSVGHRTS